MLQQHREAKTIKAPQATPLEAAMGTPTQQSDRMQTFFNAAMTRFLQEQRSTRSPPPRPIATADVPDVEMESVESHADQQDEYDPDDLSIGNSRRPAVAATGTITGALGAATKIRVSAISDLKEFSGRDGDEDRARTWLGKIKSAFVRDQAPDTEKCLVLGDLLGGPARTWYKQLSRTTRGNWKSLHEEFATEFCGRGTSVVRQYYQARKRSSVSLRSSISTA